MYVAWRVLRGKSTIYRVNLVAPLKLAGDQDVTLRECDISWGGPDCGAIEVGL